MNNNSMMLFYQKRYDQLNQEIFEHAITEVSDCDQYFAKLDLLKLQRERIAELLQNPNLEEEKFAEERRHVIFGDDPVYQKAKASGDEELLQKFHARSLTRYEYVESAKKFGIDLGIDYYYQSLERFDQVSDFKDGFAPVKNGKKRGFINEQGEEICEAMYDFVSYFENGFASVKIGKKRGFINEQGEQICEAKYDFVSYFENGFAEVRIGDKRGFINEQGEQICEAKYDFVSYFENGFASVKIGKKRGFINTKGEFFDKLPQ